MKIPPFDSLVWGSLRLAPISKAGMVSFYALLVQFFALVSCHVIENQKLTSQRAQNLVWRVVGPSSDSSWRITCLEPLAT